MFWVTNSEEKISLEPSVDEQVEVEPLWQVIVRNDPVNLMNYVVLVFRKVFGYDLERARKLMLQVHEDGKAIVWEGNREMAEHYVCTLQQWQLDARLTQDG